MFSKLTWPQNYSYKNISENSYAPEDTLVNPSYMVVSWANDQSVINTTENGLEQGMFTYAEKNWGLHEGGIWAGPWMKDEENSDRQVWLIGNFSGAERGIGRW